MNPVTKTMLAVMGFFIGGLALYWEVHAKDLLDVRFFIGFMLSGLVPVGTYFIGLSQKSPWDKNNGKPV